MRKIRLFDLSIAAVVERFYLMMAVVAGLGFLGQFTLAAIFGFAIAVSSILGISYRDISKKTAVIELDGTKEVERKVDWQQAA